MRKRVFFIVNLVFFLSCFDSGMASQEKAEPIYSQSNPQIERGSPNFILDSLGNILSLPKKIILFNFKVDNHRISSKTEQMLIEYIKDNYAAMKDTKIRLNQFSLFSDLKRLIKNKKVSWYWRIFPGIPVTLFTSLTGRLLGGDNYNPYTDSINIYSDIPAVALHEAGHVVDMSERIKEGWADYYTVGRILPPVTLYQEYVASEEAINYLSEKKDRKEQNNAYRILYPAYGTYVGDYSGIPYGEVAGAMVGHILSIIPRYNNNLKYKALAEAYWSGEIVRDISSDLLAKSLIQEYKRIDNELNKILLKEHVSAITFQEARF